MKRSGLRRGGLRWVIFFAAFSAQSAALAAEASPAPTERARGVPIFTIYLENDYFGGTDRHYTNGLKLSWLSRDLVSWEDEGWRKKLTRALPFVHRPGSQQNVGFAFGQNIYTPMDTDAEIPDPRDRPYAGWSYIELSLLSKTATTLDLLAVQIGIVGRHSYAQDLQRVVHKWIDDSRPNGWEHQLRDELGVNLVYERRWRFYGRTLANTFGLDIVPHAGVSLGNVQTYANAGFTSRLGFHLPSDFGVQLIRPAGTGNTPIDDLDPRVSPRHHWSLFVFGGVEGRAVARDIFLDGNTFRDSPSVDKRHFVADLTYGVGFIAGRWQFTFTRVERTREFDGQREHSARYGSVALSRAF